MAVAAVIKIPPFWPADPQIWFAQVEAQFSTRGITAQKTKFDHIVASLAPEFAQEVRDLILTPPDTTPYDVLKEQLITRTAASEQRRLQQLFNTEDLGDRKPTQMLRRMQQLLGEKAGDIDASFLRELFLQRLPSNVRMVLASTDTTNLEKMAQIADKIMEVATPPISTITVSSDLNQVRSEISDLRKLVETQLLVTRRQRRNSRGRSPTPTPLQTQNDVCWYHRKFGTSAHKCNPPCSKSENDQASH